MQLGLHKVSMAVEVHSLRNLEYDKMCKRILCICMLLFVFSGCKDKYNKWHEQGVVVNKFHEPNYQSFGRPYSGNRPIFMSNEWVGKYNVVIVCNVPKEVYDQVCKNEKSSIVTFWLAYDPVKIAKARIADKGR